MGLPVRELLLDVRVLQDTARLKLSMKDGVTFKDLLDTGAAQQPGTVG